jgi:hypothetical protein
MMGPEAHVELSIDIASDPISGWISTPSEDSQRFSGWIELVSLLEAARAASATPEDELSKTLGWLPGANGHDV